MVSPRDFWFVDMFGERRTRAVLAGAVRLYRPWPESIPASCITVGAPHDHGPTLSFLILGMIRT